MGRLGWRQCTRRRRQAEVMVRRSQAGSDKLDVISRGDKAEATRRRRRDVDTHEELEQTRRERQPAEGEEDERGDLHLNGGYGVGAQRVDDVGEPFEREGAPDRGTGFKRPGTLSAPTATVASRRSQGETKAEAKPR